MNDNNIKIIDAANAFSGLVSSSPVKTTVIRAGFNDKYHEMLDATCKSSFQLMQQIASEIKAAGAQPPEALVYRYLNAKMMYLCYSDTKQAYEDFKSMNGKFSWDASAMLGRL